MLKSTQIKCVIKYMLFSFYRTLNKNFLEARSDLPGFWISGIGFEGFHWIWKSYNDRKILVFEVEKFW